MKNIVLIAHSARTAYRYTKLILSLFGSRVRVESCSLDGAVPEEITADVVLVSTHSRWCATPPSPTPSAPLVLS